jgi:hypothetical protein
LPEVGEETQRLRGPCHPYTLFLLKERELVINVPVGLSERAARRCIVLQGREQKTEEVNRIWSEYTLQMHTIFDGKWKPNLAT